MKLLPVWYNFIIIFFLSFQTFSSNVFRFFGDNRTSQLQSKTPSGMPHSLYVIFWPLWWLFFATAAVLLGRVLFLLLMLFGLLTKIKQRESS